ncbi:MAG: phosphoadenosine phosphosulfate reductase domain-containing protein [Desulfobulbaceae bacterium]
MYSYEWDKRTRGYCLTTQTGKFVASEIRPVFAEELALTGLDARLTFDPAERRPLLWAKQNVFLYRGEEIARLHKTRYGKPLDIEWWGALCWENGSHEEAKTRRKLKLVPVDVRAMAAKNRGIMTALVANTLKRIKEMYDTYAGKCDAIYIGFSGGKDSMVLLDLCHKVLPLDVPVVFSDTDMELPDTYSVWEEIQSRYEGRPFLKVSAKTPSLENWRLFGPPSRSVRWCCAVHKSAPALVELKHRLGVTSVKAAAFLGVRGEESLSRSAYEDIGEGVKTSSQANLMPILEWGAHELWLYLLENDLLVNRAYRYGLSRVGCVMCPESSEKYAWFVDAVYPEVIKPFSDVIIETSAKEFVSQEEEREFLGSSNWQARKSGVTLKKHLSRPSEKTDGLDVEWHSAGLNTASFLEWLKTVGKVFIDETEGRFRLVLKNGRSEDVLFKVFDATNSAGNIRFSFVDDAERKRLLPVLRTVLQKSVACVGCQACEAECPTGALHASNGRVVIDETKCIHCLRCQSIDLGCWRYRSMRVPETSGSTLNGINVYKNFGLRTEFVSVYLAERGEFDQTAQLNRAKQVPAAKAWFRQGLLMDAKTITPTKLLDVFEKRGVEDSLAWDCVWMGLCNYAPVVKWLVCTLKMDVSYTDADLFDMLGNDIRDVTKKGGMQALKNMLVSTPFGMGENSVCELTKKGKLTVGFTRRARTVDPLVVLYGLYVMAEKAGRGAFTVRQMMAAEFDGEVVSPLSAFGIPPDEFKKQSMGLAAVHPDFISCSFTLGLDEVRLFPETKKRDDVVELILRK